MHTHHERYGITCISTERRLKSSKLGKGCRRFVGSAWDPTHQCIPWSGSEHCDDDGRLCGDANYEYECRWDEDRFSCAPGDLIGPIIDKYNVNASGVPVGEQIGVMFTDFLTSLIPETESLTDKVMAITCTPDGERRPKYIACAPIEEYDEDLCRDCWEGVCLGPGPSPRCGTGNPFENCPEEEFINVIQMQGIRFSLSDEGEEDELEV